MRLVLALAAATLAAASAGRAAAQAPLLPPRSWPVVELDRGKAKTGNVSCTAHTRTRIGGARRKLVPVACEQPPRSKVRDAGIAIILAP